MTSTDKAERLNENDRLEHPSCHTDIHGHDVNIHSTIDIEQRLQAAEQQCRAHGLRFTPLRRNVYELILHSRHPLGAYDLIQSLQAERSRSEGANAKMVAPPTIYRTLEFLLDLGLIHQLTSINAYVPCCHPRKRHNAIFLLCTECDRVQEYSDLPVFEINDYVQKDLGFCIEKSVMELKGRCRMCLSKDDAVIQMQ